MIPVALTIAGSDSGGGAGIQADLKTFTAFDVYGASVVTALTAQNTRGVRGIAAVEPAFVAAQLDAVLDDLDVGAAKTGMLLSAAVIDVVVDRLAARPPRHLIVDPVLVATSGAPLLEPAAIARLRERLVPLATLLTPNLREAEALTGRPVTGPADLRTAARALLDLGARAVLVKGGHLEGDALDLLDDGQNVRELSAPRIARSDAHGTGCTLSAAIAAALARGLELNAAVVAAKRYVTRAIESASRVGQGAPVLHHLPREDPLRRVP